MEVRPYIPYRCWTEKERTHLLRRVALFACLLACSQACWTFGEREERRCRVGWFYLHPALNREENGVGVGVGGSVYVFIL